MTQYTNAQILAAVVAEWSRQAISQIAASKIGTTQFVRSIQDYLVGMNIVPPSYSVAGDLQPMVIPVINALLMPTLTRMFSNVDDAAIPQLARNIVAKMAESDTYTILDGAVTLERCDVEELSALIEKNLPLQEEETYKVIH